LRLRDGPIGGKNSGRHSGGGKQRRDENRRLGESSFQSAVMVPDSPILVLIARTGKGFDGNRQPHSPIWVEIWLAGQKQGRNPSGFRPQTSPGTISPRSFRPCQGPC
jgi:hypothetical protein